MEQRLRLIEKRKEKEALLARLKQEALEKQEGVCFHSLLSLGHGFSLMLAVPPI